MSERFNALTVVTPEGISFEYLLASPLTRCLALTLDFAAIWTLYGLISVAIQMLGWISYDIAGAFYFIFYFVLSIGYFLFLEFTWRGRTLGKKVMRIQVMDARGYRLRVDQVIMRNLMRFVDGLPFFYFFGGMFSLMNVRSQRLGDLVAGTVVVRIPEMDIPKLTEIAGNRFNSFRDHPRLEALLRERISPEQAKIALQALQRRDTLQPQARLELFAKLADIFKDAVTFPGDIAELLSDEQYVRNCVDSIFRGAK